MTDANPQSPAPTDNDWIDELLDALDNWFAGTYTNFVAEPRLSKAQAKATLQNKIAEARIDELEKAIQQYILTTKANPDNFSEYAHTRLKTLQQGVKK